MRISPNTILCTQEVLSNILHFLQPTKITLLQYFRAHPYLNNKERLAISEAAYCLLRNKSVYTAIIEHYTYPMIPIMRKITLISLMHTVGSHKLTGLSLEEITWLSNIQLFDTTTLPLITRLNLPLWLIQKLTTRFPKDTLIKLISALNTTAPLDIRVNIIKMSLKNAISKLLIAHIPYKTTPYAPFGIRILKKLTLRNLSIFNHGAIEIQDEGSQLIAQIVGAKRNEIIVDFCAGTGGKTLAIGANMYNTGILYAFDTSEKRLIKLKQRIKNSGLLNVYPMIINDEKDIKINRFINKIDRILIDAPCSGLGTLRRNPDIKWRYTENKVHEMHIKQNNILAHAARLVKIGGRVIYATCSFLSEENEEIIKSFLFRNTNFTIIFIEKILKEQKIILKMQKYLKMLPHLHQTDGFFAAVLERKY